MYLSDVDYEEMGKFGLKKIGKKLKKAAKKIGKVAVKALPIVGGVTGAVLGVKAGKALKKTITKKHKGKKVTQPVNAVDSSTPGVNEQVATVTPQIPAAATVMPANISEPMPYIANGSGPQYPELEPIDVTGQRPSEAGFGGNGLMIAALGLGAFIVLQNSGGRRKGARRGEI